MGKPNTMTKRGRPGGHAPHAGMPGMADDLDGPRPDARQPTGETIEATFRNGTLTAVSVVAGFSLSFLTRWAGIPGPWQALDLVAVAAIVLGIACQVACLASLLSPRSLLVRKHDRAVRVFLFGLAFVAAGVGLALAGDISGYGQRLLGS